VEKKIVYCTILFGPVFIVASLPAMFALFFLYS